VNDIAHRDSHLERLILVAPQLLKEWNPVIFLDDIHSERSKAQINLHGVPIVLIGSIEYEQGHRKPMRVGLHSVELVVL
jgi:hypothetical protein